MPIRYYCSSEYYFFYKVASVSVQFVYVSHLLTLCEPEGPSLRGPILLASLEKVQTANCAFLCHRQLGDPRGCSNSLVHHHA